MTGPAAVQGLFTLHMALHGPEHLREKRARTAAACHAWLVHRAT
ncbi:hypothetical protein HNP84_003695 [Thermocatellispora tengchongensis]|uniref:Uncharacterized protein n=1 Tax=Thermocatellispora tengchongensis TaxID=1073253 RepID=A0A840P4N6_9ACTN|nr:hypothetical protein [Thermocatellispora tengchongensis]MBB5133969.1 hypothetical protein [Thermocatellispora tengchongensis]